MRGGSRKFIDMTGRKYGRLLVLERAGTSGQDGQRRTMWLCQCDCGNTTVVIGANLRAGMTRSCGCLRREISAQSGRKRWTGKKASVTT